MYHHNKIVKQTEREVNEISLKKNMAREGKGVKGVRDRDIPAATFPFTHVRTS